MNINIPKTDKKRIVIVGAGFAGLKLARHIRHMDYQIVLIDKNNYHQFQPLFYQVAMSGLEPSSIVFPLRKMFQRLKNVFIRVTEVISVDPTQNMILTSLGELPYDYLVLAVGTETNFFGNEQLAATTIPMKSVSEALYLRNRILRDFEEAVTTEDEQKRQAFMDIVIVGGGPTGVEIAGALAEMKRYIIPKDYPELNKDEIDIYLIEGGSELLGAMSEESQQKSQRYLEKLGVKIKLNTLVTEYDGESVRMKDGTTILTNKVIWAAGVRGSKLGGLSKEAFGPAGRIKVNRYNQVEGFSNVFAIGDIAFMTTEKYPKGHPQLAQAALQQAKLLAKNLHNIEKGRPLEAFEYVDKGSMATIGRNLAVADLPFMKIQGFIAWLIWMFVHLFSLVGVKNKAFVFINWVWNYFTYDQSLRLIIRPKVPRRELMQATVIQQE